MIIILIIIINNNNTNNGTKQDTTQKIKAKDGISHAYLPHVQLINKKKKVINIFFSSSSFIHMALGARTAQHTRTQKNTLRDLSQHGV